jgi:hypothetical protein
MSDNIDNNIVSFLYGTMHQFLVKGNHEAASMDANLLSLYQKGLVHLSFDDTGELMVEITAKGMLASNINYAETLTLPNPIEA